MYTINFRCLSSGVTLFAMSVLASLLLLTGCGGGGGAAAPAAPVAATSVISGVASKGPLNGSTVCAFAIAAGAKGAPLGTCAKTNATGNYSIDLGTYTGPVLFEASGGNYIDEATGLTVPLASPLRSILTNAAGGAASVAVTALTELAYQQANTVAAGLTVARIQAAVTNVQTNFGVSDIINTMPVDALNVPVAATAVQKSYALALATISQYQSTQPAGTSLVNALLPIQACLAAPATGCGTGATSFGNTLYTSMTAFQTSHPALAAVNLPVAGFGSVLPANGVTPAYTVSPSTLSFATQAVGTTSPVQTVTLTNTGVSPWSPGVMFAIPIGGSEFTKTTTCGTNLAVGASCTISVAFSPKMYNSPPNSLNQTELVSIGASGAANLILNGLVPPLPTPSISITPASLTYAAQAIGTSSAAQTVTLTNTGTAPLDIYCISTTGPNSCQVMPPLSTIVEYGQTNNCVMTNSLPYPPTTNTMIGGAMPFNIMTSANLAVGASCTISVKFTPSALQTAKNSGVGILSIITNAANTPSLSVPLSSGTAPVATTGAGTAAQYFTKRAVGNSWSLMSTCISFTGAGAPGCLSGVISSSSITASTGGVVTTVIPSSLMTITNTSSIDATGALIYTGTVVMPAFNGVPASTTTTTGTVLPANFIVGTSWISAPATLTSTATTSTIRAFNVTRTVPAGTFTDCLQIDSTVTINSPAGTTVSSTTRYVSPTAGSTVDSVLSTVFTSATASGNYSINLGYQLQAGYVALP
jgi:hypothetical protein